MSKRCPECRYINEDSRIFCASCGATLDAHLRLIQDLEKQKDTAPQEKERKKEEMSFYVSRAPKEEKKHSVWPWVILALAVAAAAAWFFLNG